MVDDATDFGWSQRGPGDAIRIVPLHVPDGAARAAPAAAPMTYRGGPLLTRVQVYTVFWGTSWSSSQGDRLARQVNAFFDFILTSPLMDQLGEYSVAGKKIGHGSRTGTRVLPTPAPTGTVTDGAIQRLLRQEITAGALPVATANTLYFLYLPQGVRVVQGGSSSCQAFCGYHSDVGGELFYAVMPYPGCSGCLGGLATIDALTSTSSHELCEAITDPVPGEGWYNDSEGEIGDVCAWQTKKLGGYTVQLEWSNRANGCK